jgi:hypothetical protein
MNENMDVIILDLINNLIEYNLYLLEIYILKILFIQGRSLPPQQQPSQYRQQQSHNTNTYSDSHDIYGNGYKHSNSAPMIVRRKLPE